MTRPTEPIVLALTIQVVARRGDDPRPITHHLGSVHLTGDDRYRWRDRIADALLEAAAVARLDPTTQEGP